MLTDAVNLLTPRGIIHGKIVYSLTKNDRNLNTITNTFRGIFLPFQSNYFLMTSHSPSWAFDNKTKQKNSFDCDNDFKYTSSVQECLKKATSTAKMCHPRSSRFLSFTKFTGKRQWSSACNFIKMRLDHRWFSVNFC